MRRLLTYGAFALAGVLVALGLGVGAYVLAGDSLSEPAEPVRVDSLSPATTARDRTATVPARTRPAPPGATTARTGTRAAPPPPATTTDDDGGGDDDDGRGRGRGRGRGGDDESSGSGDDGDDEGGRGRGRGRGRGGDD